MKKPARLITVITLALAILAAGCASGNSPPPPRPRVKPPPAAQPKIAAKPRVKVFTGTIVAVDQAAGTVVLKGPKREMEFQVGEKEKKRLDGLRLGDKLLVKHVDETALSIVKLRASTSALALPEAPRDRRIDTPPGRLRACGLVPRQHPG